MNFQFYLEKLFSSKEFEKFRKEKPHAFPCSCFFVFDLEKPGSKEEKIHFDYYDPDTNRMFSFKLERGIELVPVEMFDSSKPKKIGANYDLDFETVKDIIRKKMEKESVKGNIQRILISLQPKDNEDYLVCTVFLSSFGLLKVNIHIATLEITEFEKKTFLDMLKIHKN